MLSRYWCIGLAIAGLILTGANPPAKQEPNSTAVSDKEPANTATFVSDEYKPHADKYAEACYNADNHNSADLCAQWRAAIAAEKAADATTWANWISTAGALLSFLSIILVLVALGQTRKANRISGDEFTEARKEAAALAKETASALAQTRRSADAATQQSVVANKIFVQEFRPYVMARALSFMVQTESGQPFTKVLIANIGRGVAKACKVYAATEVADWENPIFGDVEQCGKPLFI